MSIQIIKAGLCDSLQDYGRTGYRHLGIQPGGVMDRFAAAVSNLLVGKPMEAPLLECHFPAATMLIERDCLLAIGGADFSPTLNDEPFQNWQPAIVRAGTILEFKKWIRGAWVYISFRETLKLQPWLNSYSTDTKVGLGGWQGRILQKKDRLTFLKPFHYTPLSKQIYRTLPWRANPAWEAVNKDHSIAIMKGPEFEWLSAKAKHQLENKLFNIHNLADRMGYRLEGKLDHQSGKELLSSATAFGTLQLLPNGELIVLMADHQVTGGYPRIAQVVTAHLPKLAQKKPGDFLKFYTIDRESATMLNHRQQQHLVLLQRASQFKLQTWGFA